LVESKDKESGTVHNTTASTHSAGKETRLICKCYRVISRAEKLWKAHNWTRSLSSVFRSVSRPHSSRHFLVIVGSSTRFWKWRCTPNPQPPIRQSLPSTLAPHWLCSFSHLKSSTDPQARWPFSTNWPLWLRS